MRGRRRRRPCRCPSARRRRPRAGTRGRSGWVASSVYSPSTTVPSRASAAFRAVPSASSTRFFDCGASRPNAGPSAFITGSARQPIRSQAPRTTATSRAFARERQTGKSCERSASSTSSASVTTVTVRDRPPEFPLSCLPGVWKPRQTNGPSIARSRTVNQASGFPSDQAGMWTLRVCRSLRFLYILGEVRRKRREQREEAPDHVVDGLVCVPLRLVLALEPHPRSDELDVPPREIFEDEREESPRLHGGAAVPVIAVIRALRARGIDP